MIFYSRFAALRVNVRPPIEVPHPTLPKIVSRVTPMVAEFGQHGGETVIDAPDGSRLQVADIRGHYFDSVTAQEQNGWTDDERLEVEETLTRLAAREPDKVRVMEAPAAAVPWPTYAETPRERIVELAVAMGFVAEALAYEGENGKRKTVTGPLREILDAQASAAEAEAALTAA